MNKLDTLFDKVEAYIKDAHLVAWDGCHKTYLAMDENEASWFRNPESDYTVFEGTPSQMLSQVELWYEDSCSLRFVSAVGATNKFVTLISQEDSWEADRENEEGDEFSAERRASEEEDEG